MDGGMRSDESLSLPHRLESPHHSLPNTVSFMRLLSTIIGILIGDVKRLRDDFAMGNRITAQFVRHDSPRLASVALD